jgi:hypothetical protein
MGARDLTARHSFKKEFHGQKPWMKGTKDERYKKRKKSCIPEFLSF